MISARIYLAQRLSALVMIPLVLGHIAVMIYAIQGGLSVGEILSRTQGSTAWFLFYSSFVVAVSIHAALGLSVIAIEWGKFAPKWACRISMLICAGLLAMGGHAIWAITFATTGS